MAGGKGLGDRRRVVLHIGSQKTGSTAFQSALALSKHSLRRHGVFYPRHRDTWKPVISHRDLRDALLEAPAAARHSGEALETFRSRLKRYIVAFERSGLPIAILSAEGLSGSIGVFPSAFAPLRDAYKVDIVYVYRRPDRFVESFYREMTKWQRLEGRRFASFVEIFLRDHLTQRFTELTCWSEVFGEAAITVVPYEPAVPSFDAVRSILVAAGLEGAADDLRNLRGVTANASLSRVQTEFVRRVAEDGLRMNWAQLMVLSRFERDRGTFLGDASRARILDACAGDMERVRASFVRDGRSVMFPVPPERPITQAEDWDEKLPPWFERRMRLLLGLPGQKRND